MSFLKIRQRKFRGEHKERDVVNGAALIIVQTIIIAASDEIAPGGPAPPAVSNSLSS